MEIKSLEKTEYETIFRAFSQAFADYEVQWNKAQLKTMLKRRGFVPELSFAAFDDNDEIVAFTFNGIGHVNGIQTAYDTGTGTLKDYRGRGLASGIFLTSLPHLKKNKIEQYLLEVMQHNPKAISVYKKLGFETTREFNYFMQKSENIDSRIKNSDYSVKQMETVNLDSISDFWDFYPSWQNNFEAINRAPEDFISLGVYTQKKLIGYSIFEPASGDITQIAVEKQNRRKGIATLLLNEVMKYNKADTVKFVNTAISCNSITEFLKAKNIELKGKQFEMIKKL
ncbi:MAG: GNAT family N-acetyltransferase [Salegentibacter sp.]|uniref:Ribosomal protein S18 acetylase RimI n=1 Tax=Salegentibacter flavus TaxID=287099 RepID=A0A1I5D064_9FLAO|nr:MULTISPECIES: GNAT family N-acetyltransferase [Salegentibacter]MDR9458242.1 GNAT family N-acetyltransferase [Salegentibacter sp.]SFN92608.1 Ribosomal protein S18 acetylase RimI [Salegentibacter flavus]